MRYFITVVFFLHTGLFPVFGTELILRDGTVCRGTILSETLDYFTFQVGSSKLNINKLLVVKKDGVPFAGGRVAPQPSMQPLAPETDDRAAREAKTEQPTVPVPDWVVTLKSGSVVCGKRISENARVLVLDTDGFTQTIFKNTIVAIDSGKTAPIPPSDGATASVPPPRIRSTSEPSAPGASPPAPPVVLVAPKSPLATQVPAATKEESPSVVGPHPQVNVIAPPSEAPVASTQVMPRNIKADLVSFENKEPVDAGASANAATPARETMPTAPSVDRQTGLPRPRVNVVSISEDVSSDEAQQQTDTAVHAPALPQAVADDNGKPPAVNGTDFTGGITVIPAPRSTFYAQQSRPTISAAPEKTASSGDRKADTSAAQPTPLPVVQPVPPLALAAPAPLPADAAKKKTVSLINQDRQAKLPSATASSGSQQPPPPMAPAPARDQRKRCSDGRQELVLADGTVFIGKIASQTERVILFSSEGASISILKNFVKSIDGEPYRFVQSSGTDSLLLKAGTATSVFSGQQVKKRAPIHAVFRILPQPEIPPGTTAAMLADSMQHSTDWKCRSRAARHLGAMGPWGVSATPSASKLLSDTSQSKSAVPVWIDSLTVNVLLPPALEAARALSQLGAQGEAELLQALKSENPMMRRNAVFGLGNCFLESAEKAIKGVLRDPDPSVRQAALGSLRVSTSLPHLVAALEDPDGDVRATAAVLLGKLSDRSVVERLAPLAKDNSQQVRRAVAEALGTLGVPEAVPPLIVLCEDSDNFVRAEAIRALGKTKDGNAVTTLINALKGPTADVRATAVEALGVLRDSRSIPSLYAAMKDKDETVRKKARAAVKQLTEIPLLIAALDDESTTVRANTAYVLWLMTGQDLGANRTKWEAWAAQKTRKGKEGE